MAFGLFFVISDFPEEATWLTAEEKAFVKARLEDDVGRSGRDEKMELGDVLRPFRDCEYVTLRRHDDIDGEQTRVISVP